MFKLGLTSPSPAARQSTQGDFTLALRGSSSAKTTSPITTRPPNSTESTTKMISDDDLYRLAIFLGSAAMLLIILYHFLEVNSVEEPSEKVGAAAKTDGKGAAQTAAR
ncbi:hypothetical protein LOCC1_G000479 [Lachnellula occidentalis]|uniref:Dolichyl-diphosphooligosaccharide--protein glycosyltransferase subunit 4 n=1 Tax=Lachnellula occidentalis TaxID=215460 RepID=A0A8H8SAJ7_9HELO|nr:hypothetical protein LOCC1_G000479 [Lachnellula occidentalis]